MKRFVNASFFSMIALAVFLSLDITSTGPSLQKFLVENGTAKEIIQILYFPISFFFAFILISSAIILSIKKRLKNDESTLGVIVPIAGYLMFYGILQAYLKIGAITSFWLFMAGLIVFIVGSSILENKIRDKKILSKSRISLFSNVSVMLSAALFLGIFLLLK